MRRGWRPARVSNSTVSQCGHRWSEYETLFERSVAVPAYQRATPYRRQSQASTGEGGYVHLVLLADTHVPRRARDLPPAVWAAVDVADVVVHAGDWVSQTLLDV